MHKILRAIIGLFFFNVFQLSIFDGYFIPFQLYILIKGLTFDTFSGIFLFLYDLLQPLPHTENIYHLHHSDLLSFVSFLSSLKNQYMTPLV